MGQSRPLFAYFRHFHVTIQILNWKKKSKDVFLGFEPGAADRSTEQWRPPKLLCLTVLCFRLSFCILTLAIFNFLFKLLFSICVFVTILSFFSRARELSSMISSSEYLSIACKFFFCSDTISINPLTVVLFNSWRTLVASTLERPHNEFIPFKARHTIIFYLAGAITMEKLLYVSH